MRIELLRHRLRALGAKPKHEHRVLRLWSQALPQDAGKRRLEDFMPQTLRDALLPVRERIACGLYRCMAEYLMSVSSARMKNIWWLPLVFVVAGCASTPLDPGEDPVAWTTGMQPAQPVGQLPRHELSGTAAQLVFDRATLTTMLDGRQVLAGMVVLPATDKPYSLQMVFASRGKSGRLFQPGIAFLREDGSVIETIPTLATMHKPSSEPTQEAIVVVVQQRLQARYLLFFVDPADASKDVVARTTDPITFGIPVGGAVIYNRSLLSDEKTSLRRRSLEGVVLVRQQPL